MWVENACQELGNAIRIKNWSLKKAFLQFSEGSAKDIKETSLHKSKNETPEQRQQRKTQEKVLLENKKIVYKEFSKILKALDLGFTKTQRENLFDAFDSNKSDSINYKVFYSYKSNHL